MKFMKYMRFVFALCCAAGMAASVRAATAAIQQTTRGAIVETERVRVEIADGIVVSIVNKFTREEYLDREADLNAVLPHLPSGLGTRSTPEEQKGAKRLYVMPWWEHPNDLALPNQHYPLAASAFEYNVLSNGCTLVYRGLRGAGGLLKDEEYRLEVAVDSATGDVLLTPAGSSARAGVYGVNLTLAPFEPAITAEVPLFDGVRITRDMKPQLWINQWGSYWDYAFTALNGRRKGAVGIWCQDAELKTYKHLFFLINDQGISFAFSSLNLPPFHELKEAQGMTWRIQAFEHSWAQAAARFRDWRQANVKIAPRTTWATNMSWVSMGVNGNIRWFNLAKSYLGPECEPFLGRTITFAPTIRMRNFDTAHFDNTPYATFSNDMAVLHKDGGGHRLMAYLQPMIMNPSVINGSAATPEQKEIIEISRAADTIYAFNPDPSDKWFTAQHHLGYTPWQEWFLKCISEYIGVHGADGIYHDQSYIAPVDERGLVDDRTSHQGMADYFYKAQAQNPNSIHATEHLNEVNSVGASLGIGSGIHWGTAKTMRRQRMKFASPVNNALHYPNAVMFSFPHFTEYGGNNARSWHMAMDISERRGEIPGNNLQQSGWLLSMPFDKWANEFKVNRLRAVSFVKYGLRPVFPEKWDRAVASYFRGAKGEEFRYELTVWGTRFVQVVGGHTNLIYGRVTGVTELNPEPGHGTEGLESRLLRDIPDLVKPRPYVGGIAGWPMYNDDGPSGLDPHKFYCLDPAVKLPAIHFAGSMYEGCVGEGFLHNGIGMMRLAAIPEKGNYSAVSVSLVSTAAPSALWVVGRPAKASPAGTGRFSIQARIGDLCALFKDPPAGFTDLKSVAVLRSVSETGTDNFGSDWLTAERLTTGKIKVGTNEYPSLTADVPGPILQLNVALKPPPDAKKGTIRVHCFGQTFDRVSVNGVDMATEKDRRAAGPMDLPKLAVGEPVVLSVQVRTANLRLAFEWLEDAAR